MGLFSDKFSHDSQALNLANARTQDALDKVREMRAKLGVAERERDEWMAKWLQRACAAKPDPRMKCNAANSYQLEESDIFAIWEFVKTVSAQVSSECNWKGYDGFMDCRIKPIDARIKHINKNCSCYKDGQGD